MLFLAGNQRSRTGADAPRVMPQRRRGGGVTILGRLCTPLAILTFLFMLATEGAGAASSQSGYVTVDFDNVDLRVFIKFVSETTGRIFILDERVKGTVSIVFANQIPIDELDKVLESVLEVKGYAAIPAGPVTKIVPLNTAKQRGVEVGVTGPGRTGKQR